MKTDEHRRSADDPDTRLRQALLGLPADVPEALSQRVMAQWHEAHNLAPAVGQTDVSRPWLSLWGRGGRTSWVLGAAGLTAGLALVLNTWLRTPDPTLDELLQPDVLSQMTAGEM